MSEQTAKGGADLGSLRNAIESGGPDALMGFYAEEAELCVVDAARPEGPAFELKGRAEIGKYLRTVQAGGAGRKLKGGAVFGGRGVAFVEECRYPDGAQVSVETMLEVEGGLVVRQLDAVSGEATGGGKDDHGPRPYAVSRPQR